MSSGRFSHLARQVRIESKVFSVEFDEYYAGSVIKFWERSRHGSFELKMGLDGAHWLGNCLLEAVRNRDDRNFFRIHRFNSLQLWINRFENNRGAFLRVSFVVGNSGLKCIYIPMGINASGWSECARMILSIFPSGGKVGSEVKEKPVKVSNMKIDAPGRKGGEVVSRTRNSAEIKKGVSFAECLVYGEWTRAVVCSKMDGSDEWWSIQKTLSSFLGFMIKLKPFQDDKAVFLCQDEREAAKVGKIGICRLEGLVHVSLQQWRPEINRVKERMAFGGGWIAIEGLPFHLWKRNVFCKIAYCCGGLIEVDKRTEFLTSLREARIKVGKNENSFIPAVIRIKEGDTVQDVRVRPLTKFVPHSRRIFSHNLNRKVEDEFGKGKGVRGSRWGMDSSKIQIGSPCRKQAKPMWRVKRDSRIREGAGVQADEVEYCRERGVLLRRLNQKQGFDLASISVKKTCVVGEDFRKFDQFGTDREKEQENGIKEFHLKESSSRLSCPSLKGERAYFKDVGSGYLSDPGPIRMNGPPSCVGSFKAHGEPSKLPNISGSLMDNILGQGPLVSVGGGRTKLGPFNPKSPNRFIFNSSFSGSSTDRAKQTNSDGISVLKPADSDDEDQKSEEDVNLGDDEMDEGEMKTHSLPIGLCCRQKCLTFKEEEEIFGQGIKPGNPIEIPLETEDISSIAADWNDQFFTEEVISDSESDLSRMEEVELSKAETGEEDREAVEEASVNLQVLFEESRMDVGDAGKPKVSDKRERDGGFIQYRRKKKSVDPSIVSNEAVELFSSGEGVRYKSLLKKMNLSLSQPIRAVQEVMSRKKEISSKVQMFRGEFSSERGKGNCGKGPNTLS